LAVVERSRGTLDMRLVVRFPVLGTVFARLVGKLSPGSRLRQVLLARAVRLASEAYNRRDLAAVVVGLDPDFEYFAGREWVQAGFAEPVYRGMEGYRAYIAATSEGAQTTASCLMS
jgi:hypothetical protein